MTPAEHLTLVHAEARKMAQGFAAMALNNANPAELDKIALVARSVSAALDVFAERAEAVAGGLLDES